LDEGKLSLAGEFAKKVIYHDPCYLGRHSEIFEEPREILAQSRAWPGDDGVPPQPQAALCCGGGGGRLWMETEPEQRFSTHKMRQADAKGAEVVATCCPYCISMLTDSAKGENLDEKIQVKDMAEIVADSL
jgi:Fe-S oxidoreductase